MRISCFCGFLLLRTPPLTTGTHPLAAGTHPATGAHPLATLATGTHPLAAGTPPLGNSQDDLGIAGTIPD